MIPRNHRANFIAGSVRPGRILHAPDGVDDELVGGQHEVRRRRRVRFLVRGTD